jgi:hypothetical protein
VGGRIGDAGDAKQLIWFGVDVIGLVAAGVGVAIAPDGIQCIRLQGAIYKNLTEISACTSHAVKTIPIPLARDPRSAGDNSITATATGKTRDAEFTKITQRRRIGWGESGGLGLPLQTAQMG